MHINVNASRKFNMILSYNCNYINYIIHKLKDNELLSIERPSLSAHDLLGLVV